MWMALSAVVLLAGVRAPCSWPPLTAQVMIFLVAALPPKGKGNSNPNKNLVAQFKRKVEADDKGMSVKELDLEKGSTTRVDDSDDEYTHTPKPRGASHAADRDSVSRRSSRRSVDADRRSERSRRSSRHRAPISEEDEEEESAATEENEAASTVRSSRSRGSRKHRKSRRQDDDEEDERTHGYVQCACRQASIDVDRCRLIVDDPAMNSRLFVCRPSKLSPRPVCIAKGCLQSSKSSLAPRRACPLGRP